MKTTGTLRFADFGTGAWLLQADDGRRWQLVPAPKGFAAGDRVTVEGEPDAQGASLQMAGPLLRVKSISRA
jgi:hypothetical protein